jgi:thiol-disulfide isomerase/thioredoxin
MSVKSSFYSNSSNSNSPALSAGANTNVNANLNGFMGLKFTKTQIIIGVVVFLGVVGIGIYLYTTTKPVTAFHANRENVPKGDNAVKTATVKLFYVDWCPHCKTAKPVWNDTKTEYEGTVINGYKLSFLEYNCTKETPETQALMDKYKIEGFPSIILIKDNQVIDYDAKPSKATMVQFLNTVL